MAALVVTVALATAVLVVLGITVHHHASSGEVGQAVLDATVGAAMVGLVYGGLVYLLARWGYYRRAQVSDELDDVELDDLFDPGADPGLLTILVPSYREDLAIVRQTVLTAALQDYPSRRVVVLVDDPPSPSVPEHADALDAMRRLPVLVQAQLSEPAARLAEAEREFHERVGRHGHLGPDERAAEARRLAGLHDYVAAWLEEQAGREDVDDHTARLFVELTFVARAAACRRRAAALLAKEPGESTTAQVRQEYHRLSRMFSVEITTFERKQYADLSHAPNKAMNLNAYIGLIGRRWREVRRHDGLHLEPADAWPGRSAVHGPVLDVPASPWLLTVDADSLLVHDYAGRLVRLLRRPEHARTAVVQTPYSAVPGAPGRVERAAGATTDIMHRVHQGSTWFGATYWVGANALLRTAALTDIASTAMEGRRLVTRYIQDRTVIEDTESTVDLVDAGWQLHNYPDRLAYSATPADYGALLVQRRRWANGGLIILPKLLRSYWNRGLRGRLCEAVLRVHYLVSIATVCLAMTLLMLLPFSEAVPVPLVVATCLPYFAVYTRDLRLTGRRRRDMVDVYALNLLLFPVNLAGVLTSLRQAASGKQIPFGRTPKVADRTAVPALYVFLTALLIALWTVAGVVHLFDGRHLHVVVQTLNIAVLLYAGVRFIGLRCAAQDLARPLSSLRERSSRRMVPGPRRAGAVVPSAGIVASHTVVEETVMDPVAAGAGRLG